MNLSSIVVYTAPGHIDGVKEALSNLPGVEVHYLCLDTGRMIIIQEMPDNASEVDSLKHIKTLPNILAAELVYHYQEQILDVGQKMSNAMEILS